MTDVMAFVFKHYNRAVDVDGKFGAQCVDLMRLYITEVLRLPQPAPVAGAADLWRAFDLLYYQRITNGPTNYPEPGDIVVWDNRVGAWGHVAIAVRADSMRLLTYDQNWPTGSLPHIQEHDYHGVLGWFRAREVTP